MEVQEYGFAVVPLAESKLLILRWRREGFEATQAIDSMQVVDSLMISYRSMVTLYDRIVHLPYML